MELKKNKLIDVFKFRKLGIVITSVIVAAGVFILGVNVGNQNIVLSFGGTSTGLPSRLDYTTVNQLYTLLRTKYDGKLTETQILNGIKEGLANAPGDPYTEYFTPQAAKAFNGELNNSFSGIGAELSADQGGNIEVIAPISGSPAAQAGLQPKDLIASINGKSTTGMSVGSAVNEIRGPAGTKVTLGIIRNGQSLSITIVRQTITVPSVNTKILNGNIGYMQITTFSSDTVNLAIQAANKFKQAHVKGIILDLRNNPGGYLSAAIGVSSLWLNPGQTVLQEKRGNQVIQTYTATGGDILNGIKTVVLINGGSASSSEITTGALHDNKQAYVIGTKSFGKGVVQQLINLKGGAEFKVTVASWYRPNGQDINKKGITPDQTVNLSAAQLSAGNDSQLQAALHYLGQ